MYTCVCAHALTMHTHHTYIHTCMHTHTHHTYTHAYIISTYLCACVCMFCVAHSGRKRWLNSDWYVYYVAWVLYYFIFLLFGMVIGAIIILFRTSLTKTWIINIVIGLMYVSIVNVIIPCYVNCMLLWFQSTCCLGQIYLLLSVPPLQVSFLCR